MSTGFLVGDTVNRRVYRQVRGTVVQVGPEIVAATAETVDPANIGMANNRACQFRGSNDIYTLIREEVFRYAPATDTWELVFTTAAAGNGRQSSYMGPVVMPVNGVQSLVMVYMTAGNYRIVTSADGINFVESASLPGLGVAESLYSFRINGTVLQWFQRLGSNTYYFTLNPSTVTVSWFSTFSFGGQGGSTDYFTAASFKGRQFMIAHTGGTRRRPAMFEIAGGGMSLIFGFGDADSTVDGGFNNDMKWLLFESAGKLIAFINWRDSGGSGTDTAFGWHAYVMDTTGGGGALQVESEVTDIVFPPGLGRNSGSTVDGGWGAIIDYEANINGEPEIGLCYRPNGVNGSAWDYYIWNGIAALIGNSGAPDDTGGNAAAGLPFDQTGSSKYFWTLDALDIAIDGVLPALGGEQVDVSLFAPPTVVNHGAVTAGPFEAGETVTSTSGGSATISRFGVGSGFIHLDNVTGVFADTDTITQTTGINAGANAVQSGATTGGPVAVDLFFLFQTKTQTQFTKSTITSSDKGTVNVGTKTIEGLTAKSEGEPVSAVLNTPGDGIVTGELVDLRATVELP
jgi:hypothetical protein